MYYLGIYFLNFGRFLISWQRLYFFPGLLWCFKSTNIEKKFLLQIVEKNREKLQKSVAPEKREKNKKYRLMEKEYQKRRQKYDDARLKVNNFGIFLQFLSNSKFWWYVLNSNRSLLNNVPKGALSKREWLSKNFFREITGHQSSERISPKHGCG